MIWRDDLRYVRHLKRGTVYRVVGHLCLQSSARPEADGTLIVEYTNDEGGRFARDLREFCDGRFAEISTDEWFASK